MYYLTEIERNKLILGLESIVDSLQRSLDVLENDSTTNDMGNYLEKQARRAMDKADDAKTVLDRVELVPPQLLPTPIRRLGHEKGET